MARPDFVEMHKVNVNEKRFTSSGHFPGLRQERTRNISFEKMPSRSSKAGHTTSQTAELDRFEVERPPDKVKGIVRFESQRPRDDPRSRSGDASSSGRRGPLESEVMDRAMLGLSNFYRVQGVDLSKSLGRSQVGNSIYRKGHGHVKGSCFNTEASPQFPSDGGSQRRLKRRKLTFNMKLKDWIEREAKNQGKGSGADRGESFNLFEKARVRPWHRKASKDSDSSIELSQFKS